MEDELDILLDNCTKTTVIVKREAAAPYNELQLKRVDSWCASTGHIRTARGLMKDPSKGKRKSDNAAFKHPSLQQQPCTMLPLPKIEIHEDEFGHEYQSDLKLLDQDRGHTNEIHENKRCCLERAANLQMAKIQEDSDESVDLGLRSPLVIEPSLPPAPPPCSPPLPDWAIPTDCAPRLDDRDQRSCYACMQNQASIGFMVDPRIERHSCTYRTLDAVQGSPNVLLEGTTGQNKDETNDADQEWARFFDEITTPLSPFRKEVYEEVLNELQYASTLSTAKEACNAEKHDTTQGDTITLFYFQDLVPEPAEPRVSQPMVTEQSDEGITLNENFNSQPCELQVGPPLMEEFTEAELCAPELFIDSLRQETNRLSTIDIDGINHILRGNETGNQNLKTTPLSSAAVKQSSCEGNTAYFSRRDLRKEERAVELNFGLKPVRVTLERLPKAIVDSLLGKTRVERRGQHARSQARCEVTGQFAPNPNKGYVGKYRKVGKNNDKRRKANKPKA